MSKNGSIFTSVRKVLKDYLPKNPLQLNQIDFAETVNEATAKLEAVMDIWNKKVCPELIRVDPLRHNMMFFVLLAVYRPTVSLHRELLVVTGFSGERII